MEILRRMFRNGEPAAPLRLAARAALERTFHQVDAQERLEDVLLVVSELVQNVTQHTGGDGELVLSAGDGVLVEVGDGDPATPQLRRPDPRRPGGRGLLLVKGMATEWGTRSGATGKVVWARLPAPGGSGRE